jgi:hypothetical protein
LLAAQLVSFILSSKLCAECTQARTIVDDQKVSATHAHARLRLRNDADPTEHQHLLVGLTDDVDGVRVREELSQQDA